MKFLLAYYLLICFVTEAATGATRIIGGDNIVIDKCSYQLSLQRNAKHVCGATIISKTWVITAAACVKGSSKSELSLRAGSSSYKSGGSVHNVKNVILHNMFNEKTKDYNIALIEVTKAFDPKSGKPIQMWSEGSPINPGISGLATGWGFRTAGGTILSDILQQVSVPVVDHAVCAATDALVTNRQICAGFTSGGKDICEGDLGGPLVASSRLLAIASRSSCGRTGSFGVYTSIPALRAWIKSNTAI